MKTKAFYLFAMSVLSLGCWLYAGSMLGPQGSIWPVILAIAAWLLISALALAAMRVSHSAWIYAGLVVLAVSSLLPSVLARFLGGGLLLEYVLPYPLAVLITLLLYIGLALHMRQGAGTLEGEDSQARHRQAKKAALLPVLSALTLVCWLLGARTFGTGMFGFILSWLITLAIAWLLVSALALAARKVRPIAWILAAILILAGLSLPAPWFADNFRSSDFLLLSLIPTIALLMAALLLYSSLHAYGEWHQLGAGNAEGAQAQRRHAIRAVVVALAGSALLLVMILYNLYQLTLWDNTDDPLGYILLAGPVIAALLSAVMLSITLPGRMKLAGLLYSLLILALMIVVSTRAQRVDFRQLTEERAERITRAIETYHAREGRYPQELSQLTPGYILSLPRPMIILGQDWCYEGGDDKYSLGYIYREHWSDPRLIGRIYSTKGEATYLFRLCEEEFDALHERQPNYPYEFGGED